MSQDPSALGALLARVEAAQGPDRELDLAIGLALAGWEVGPDGDFGGNYLHTDGTLYAWPTSPGAGYESFTESLDAALSLVERVLPGWNFSCGSDGYKPGMSWARVFPGNRQMDGSGNQHAATPALALIAAMLQALAASTAGPIGGPSGELDASKLHSTESEGR